MTQEEEWQEEERKLSFVSLTDDNYTMLLNGDVRYSIRLPLDFSRKRAAERQKIIEGLTYNGCTTFELDYISENNVKSLSREIVDLTFERARAKKKNMTDANTDISHKTEKEEPPVELTDDLTRELTWEELAVILNTSVKRDKAPKVISFCAMLLAQTNEDQLNIGYQSESSTGKSYIPIELSSYFPQNEISIIASASPTAFYHDSANSRWDNERKTQIVELQHKILIFLDQAHFQLLEKLRPMLSHDQKELRYMITDKSQRHGLKTKNIIIKGYPSVFFCSTKQDPDEQEKTRMILLSPSIDQEKLVESLELAALRKSNSEEYRRVIQQDPTRIWLQTRIRGIRQGGIRDVVIPGNGKNVLTRFMSEHQYLLPRHQRDFPRIFSFIKSHALLNCFKREKMEGRPNTIVATDADIDAGFELYKEIELSNELGVSPAIFRTYVDVVAPLLSFDGMGGGVTREDIIKKYYEVRHKYLAPDVLRKEILPQLEIVGLIRQEVDAEDKRKMLVYPTVSTTITSAKIAESEGKNANNNKSNGGQHTGVTPEDDAPTEAEDE
jgi:hypothetical protein